MVPALAAVCRRSRAMPLDRFPLSVTTDEIDEDFLTAVRFLKSFGLRQAEIRNVWGKYNTAQPVETIREARALLDEHGIKTAILDTGFFKVPLPPDTPQGRRALDEQWALLEAGMDRAEILGTRKVRIFAFTHRPDDVPKAVDYARIYHLLRAAAARAAGRGMRLGVENLQGSYVSTGAQAARMLKAVPHQAIGLVWDPNNAGGAGERSFPDGYRLLNPARILHVHLRDYRRTPGGKVEWCAVGDGEFDNLGQIRALLKAGYKETFSLETHYRSPQGKAHASKTSLTALLRVIEQV
jgi:sugar phosphate isomerase/epimerase